MILDHTDDNGRFAKVASFLGEGFSDATLDMRSPYDVDYALSFRNAGGSIVRRYPTFTKEAAALSVAYFNQYHKNIQREYLVKTAAALKESAFQYGIPFSFDIEKVASYEEPEEDAFALSPEDMLEDAFGDMTPSARRSFALEVVAAGSGEFLTEKQAAYAGVSVDRDALQSGLILRRSYMSRDEAYLADKLWEKMASVEDPDIIAAEVAKLDAHTGLDGYYGYGKIPDPFETALGSLAKEASARVQFGGKSLELDEFGSRVEQNMEKISSRFGPDFISELKAAPSAFFNALPVPHKTALWELLDGEDVRP